MKGYASYFQINFCYMIFDIIQVNTPAYYLYFYCWYKSYSLLDLACFTEYQAAASLSEILWEVGLVRFMYRTEQQFNEQWI